MIAAIATIAEKKVQRSLRSCGNHFSYRSDHSYLCDNDRRDRLQFYLTDRSDRWDHMETILQRL